MKASKKGSPAIVPFEASHAPAVLDVIGDVFREYAMTFEPSGFDADLTDIFVEPARQRPGVEYRAASQLLGEHRRDVVDKINYWTGVRRTLVRALVSAVERRLGELDLAAEVARSRTAMVELTVYLTTLAMTFLTGNKRLRHRKP